MGAPQRKGLDPESIPHPVEVIEKDRELNINNTFRTGSIGMAPPLQTTLQFCRNPPQDEGITSPEYVRSTVYNVPANPDVAKTAKLPIALTIQPFNFNSEAAPLFVVDHGEKGPIRCQRCKAYRGLE